ncbi:MAG TPA: peptidylprolyl isomerase [Pirellulales bacterium]|jgi:cyclophilin family peptidyl-prolyl cis-trans isomerase
MPFILQTIIMTKRLIGLAALAVAVFLLAKQLSAADQPAATKQSTGATSSTEDSPKPAGDSTTAASGAEAEYRSLYKQWQALAADMAELHMRFQLPATDRAALEKQREELVGKTDELSARLQTAAEQVYAADNKNQEVGSLLFTMAATYLAQDKPEAALRLAQFLIDHQFPLPEVNRLAASAAFATMDLDAAEKYMKAAGGGKIPSDPETQKFMAAVARYRPKWEREQKFREAEAKADDLPRVKIKTTKGDIVVELFENEAPNTVANFINLAGSGFYDGTLFHRVLPQFMAQGGDPKSKDLENFRPAFSNGGPGYTIPDECTRPEHREHFRGSLSMAHTELPDSAGSQFFMCFVPTEHLDGKFTSFGRVIEGLDVLSNLQRIDPSHTTAVSPDKILKMEILRKRDHEYTVKKTGEAAGSKQ